MLKILHASSTPLAGICELMARLINENLPGVAEGRVLNNGPGRHGWYLRNDGLKIKRYDLKNPAQVREALEWATAIHCHANVGARSMNALDLLPKKIWLFQWHGIEQNGCLDRSFELQDYKHVRFLHIGQGWLERQADFFAKFDLRIVPNLISIDDEIHRPLPWDKRLQRVAFAPSTTKAGAPNDKGVAETERALAGLPLKLIWRQPFENCMREKQRSVLGIDELVTPSYHRSGLEFLSQGTPCLCSYGGAAARALKEATGASFVPFHNVKVEGAATWVNSFLKSPPKEQESLGVEARRWMEQFYAPRALLERHYLPAWTGQ